MKTLNQLAQENPFWLVTAISALIGVLTPIAGVVIWLDSRYVHTNEFNQYRGEIAGQFDGLQWASSAKVLELGKDMIEDKLSECEFQAVSKKATPADVADCGRLKHRHAEVLKAIEENNRHAFTSPTIRIYH